MIIAINKRMGFQSIFNSGTIPVAEQAMYFAEQRHKVLANNIANLETPGYKAIDISKKDFQEVIERAVEKSKDYKSRAILFEGYNTVNFDTRKGMLVYRHFEGDVPSILRHDDNNVDLDYQMTEIVKNRGLHNTSATILDQQFDMLKSAISLRV